MTQAELPQCMTVADSIRGGNAELRGSGSGAGVETMMSVLRSSVCPVL